MLRDYYKEMGGGGGMKYKREIRSLWEGNRKLGGDRWGKFRSGGAQDESLFWSVQSIKKSNGDSARSSQISLKLEYKPDEGEDKKSASLLPHGPLF
jgi:hypothetical protein